MLRIDFKTNILKDLINRYPEKTFALENSYPKLNLWLEKKANPTINQLAEIADFYNIPFGYFFLDNIVKADYPIPHYRTNSNDKFTPSDNLIETIKTIKKRQQWARDILLDGRDEKLRFAANTTVNDNIIKTAEYLRELLDLSKFWAKELPSWSEAFRLLLERTEKSGIFVVVNGVVNNNTHRKLNVSEFRGFVLYDDYAPFVFINNRDSISGKIFTLVHEIVHVLVGKSASFDLESLQPAEDVTEKFCDKVAAEFLVSEIALQNTINKEKIDYEQLARCFKVSQIVIARRLLDIKRISKKEFFDFYNAYMSHENYRSLRGGGDYYNTLPYRTSRRFINLIYMAAKQNKVLYRDAFRLTGMTPKTFDHYNKGHLL